MTRLVGELETRRAHLQALLDGSEPVDWGEVGKAFASAVSKIGTRPPECVAKTSTESAN